MKTKEHYTFGADSRRPRRLGSREGKENKEKQHTHSRRRRTQHKRKTEIDCCVRSIVAASGEEELGEHHHHHHRRHQRVALDESVSTEVTSPASHQIIINRRARAIAIRKKNLHRHRLSKCREGYLLLRKKESTHLTFFFCSCPFGTTFKRIFLLCIYFVQRVHQKHHFDHHDLRV